MKNLTKSILIAALTVLLINSSPLAAKSSNGKGGNGFPPGTHFNLNVIAKWSEREFGNFTCPAAQYSNSLGETCDPQGPDQTCLQEFGNVIFIPREGSEGQRIDVISGGKGKNSVISEENKNQLQVTDWCTEVFPNDGDNNGSSAAFFLPENRLGYEVFARVVGKPRKKRDDPPVSMTLIPDIEGVSTNCPILIDDGDGGLIPDPVETESCQLLHIGSLGSDGVTISRSGDESSTGTTKGKGANKAIPVTALFQFTGHVCLRPEPDFYDLIGENGVDTTGFCLDGCTQVGLCCSEDGVDDDLLFDHCGYLEGGVNDNPLLEPGADPTIGNVLTLGIAGVCPDGYGEYYVDCQGPFVNEWTFNIADIVDYFLTLQNNGGYVLQLRFYPNSQQE